MSRLSRDDWAIAALAALASGGLSAVAVEPLAARLGATKGSFYWHFKARHELIQAALDLWEQRSTADVIKDLEKLDRSPETRLRALFARVFEPEALTGADMALLAHSQEPPVREALQRVTQERIDYAPCCSNSAGSPRASHVGVPSSRTAPFSGICSFDTAHRICFGARSGPSTGMPTSSSQLCSTRND